MREITVGIVEDNLLLAQGIIEKLELSEEVRIVLQASNGRILLEKLLKQNVPEILLMDIEMDEMDGITATREVKRIYPDIRVLILTVFDDDNKLFEAFKAGASGYLLKDEKPARLVQAIAEIKMGGLPMSPIIANKVLGFLKNIPDSELKNNEVATLTPREKEVLEFLKHGLSVRNIAEKMFVSEKTVHKHLEHIYEKMHVRGSKEALVKIFTKKQ